MTAVMSDSVHYTIISHVQVPECTVAMHTTQISTVISQVQMPGFTVAMYTTQISTIIVQVQMPESSYVHNSDQYSYFTGSDAGV